MELTKGEIRRIEAAAKLSRFSKNIAKIAGVHEEKVVRWRRLKKNARERIRQREKGEVKKESPGDVARWKRNMEARALLKEFPENRKSILSVVGADSLEPLPKRTIKKSVEQGALEYQAYKRHRRFTS